MRAAHFDLGCRTYYFQFISLFECTPCTHKPSNNRHTIDAASLASHMSKKRNAFAAIAQKQPDYAKESSWSRHSCAACSLLKDGEGNSENSILRFVFSNQPPPLQNHKPFIHKSTTLMKHLTQSFFAASSFMLALLLSGALAYVIPPTYIISASRTASTYPFLNDQDESFFSTVKVTPAS